MDALLLGLSLGLGAGRAPGPLLAVVIRSTLQDGIAAGIRVAFSPLVTDIPIIVLAVVLAASLPETALGALGIVGGGFVIWLGLEALRELVASPQRDLLRGALTNALSPHPWVFWITVGAPILRSTGREAARSSSAPSTSSSSAARSPLQESSTRAATALSKAAATPSCCARPPCSSSPRAWC